MQKYNFYIADVDSSYKTIEGTERDIENDEEFNFKDVTEASLRYAKCEGLENIGEAKIYTEEYADSEYLRVYIPENITHKATEIKLTLYFVGKDRRLSFNNFTKYITNGFHAYWDSARKKRFVFFVKDKITPSQDKFIGSTPYIEVTYTLSNVKGITETSTKV